MLEKHIERKLTDAIKSRDGMALKQTGVPVEMHIYPCGVHGLALANDETSNQEGFGIQKECQSWIGLALDWMEQFR